MRDIKYLVVHCTAGWPDQTTQSIKDYWKNVNKWKSVGYHILIHADGTKEILASEDKITNGVAGYNSVSLHVCYKGGIAKDEKGKIIPKDTRTQAQKQSIGEVLRYWKSKYPQAKILGHRDFPKVAKACPSFDVKSEYGDIK